MKTNTVVSNTELSLNAAGVTQQLLVPGRQLALLGSAACAVSVSLGG